MSWKRWTGNLGAKSLALIAAVGLWLSVTNEIEFEKTLEFPIEYVNVPAGITPVQELPADARARIRAKGKFLGYRLRGGVCRVDLSPNQVGMNNLVIDGANLVLPGDVVVVQREVIAPRQIAVEFDETVVRDIAIHPDVVGETDTRFVQVGKTFVSPQIARVSGPRKLVDEIGLVSTEPIDIDGKRSTVRKRADLVAPGPPTVTVRPMMVEVGITIEPLVTEEIRGVELTLAGGVPAGYRSHLRPPSVQVEISGARSIVEVAVEEVTTLSLRADSWRPGTTLLSLHELRGPELVFTPTGVPRAPAPAESGTDGSPADSVAPETAEVELGQVIGRLPLPRDVAILGIRPEEIAVTVREVPKPPPEIPQEPELSP